MSDSKISSLTELTSIATDDEFVIVDKSDTSMAVSGTTKKVKTSSIIDTDGTLAGNLDSKVASQKATKTYADTKLSISSKATAVQAAAGTDDTNYLTALSAASHMNYGLSRQAIINGNFDVWQRGTSSAVGSGTYHADRWLVWRGGYVGGATVSRQDGTGVVGSQYSMRVQRDSGNSSTNAIECAYTLETVDSLKLVGKKLTLSFWVKCGANYSPTSGNLNVQIESSTGTDQKRSAAWAGDTTEGDLTTALTTSWVKKIITTTAEISSGKTQLCVHFSVTPVGTAGANDYFEIAQVQLCAGDVALPFNPKSFEEELRACQRYYENQADVNMNFNSFRATAADTRIGHIFFKSTKRNTNYAVTFKSGAGDGNVEKYGAIYYPALATNKTTDGFDVYTTSDTVSNNSFFVRALTDNEL